jgi:hypothetical protein
MFKSPLLKTGYFCSIATWLEFTFREKNVKVIILSQDYALVVTFRKKDKIKESYASFNGDDRA